MEIKAINLLSKSKIEVLFEDKRSIEIQGELMGTPEFEAYKSSINEWILPNKYKETIEENEKEEIIKKIIKFSNSKVNGSIYFID